MVAVKACGAWNITTGSSQIKVAVVDKGVDVNHREFSHVNVSFSYDVMDLVSPAKLYYRLYCEPVYDTCYNVFHGTQVGGIIFANHNANRVAGISPNVSLINISHTLDSYGDPTGEKYAIAINQAVNHGARIINNSWGASNRNEFTRAELIEGAIDNAIVNNCVVVFSSGNYPYPIYTPGMLYPTEYRPEILAVGATKSNLLRWGNSTYGTHLDVVAPGANIISTNAGNNYFKGDGTSLAAPHVSGTAALMLSVNPNLSAQTVRDIIEQTAQKVGGYSYQPTPNRPNGTWHQEMGYGLLDAHKAVLTAAYYQIYGDDEISLCDNTSYTVINQYNQSVSDVSFLWTCSENIRIVSGRLTGSVIVKGVDFGNGWLSCRVIHAGDTVSSTIDVQIVENVETVYKDVTLTSGISFPSTFTIGGTVDIASGTTITWTGKNVHFTKSAHLIVRPGGKLIVDGGTLTSACDGVMWQGIEVVGDRTKQQLAQYQGKVELRNGATIENAWCGILTGLREDTVTFATTGGIIIATDATFRNNRQSVVVNSYAYTAPSGNIANYNATFSRCTLVVDNSNLFAANNTAFAEHVRLWDVKGVGFLGCTFANQTNSPMSHGSGIHAEDAGFSLGVKCAENYIIQPGDCGCPPSFSDTCSFSGFNTAVLANTTGNPYAVTADRVRFSGNGTGIRVNGNDFVTVTRCTFDQTTWPESVRDNYGLYLNGCTGYMVEGNTFMRTTYPTEPLSSTGICVKTSGITNNSLYRNNCEKLTKGIHAVGQNGLGLMGLRMTCNHFSHGQYDIYIASKAVVASEQGSSSQGADNTFAFTQNSSFYNLGWDTITYFYKNYSNPISPYRIISNTKTIANNCPSTLCNGGGGVYMPLTGFSAQIETHATAAGDATTDGTDVATQQQFLSDSYYTAVRTLMSDSLLDLNALEQWHTAAQPIADPYSLTETRFMEGYAEFHAMKVAITAIPSGRHMADPCP